MIVLNIDDIYYIVNLIITPIIKIKTIYHLRKSLDKMIVGIDIIPHKFHVDKKIEKLSETHMGT